VEDIITLAHQLLVLGVGENPTGFIIVVVVVAPLRRGHLRGRGRRRRTGLRGHGRARRPLLLHRRPIRRRRGGGRGRNGRGGYVAQRHQLHFRADTAELGAQTQRLVLIRLFTDTNRLLRNGVVYHLGRASGPAGDLGGNRRSPLRVRALFNKDFVLHGYSSLSITAKFMLL